MCDDRKVLARPNRGMFRSLPNTWQQTWTGGSVVLWMEITLHLQTTTPADSAGGNWIRLHLPSIRITRHHPVGTSRWSVPMRCTLKRISGHLYQKASLVRIMAYRRFVLKAHGCFIPESNGPSNAYGMNNSSLFWSRECCCKTFNS